MNSNSAKALALKLMRKHRLLEKDWQFRFNNNAARAGVCKESIRRLPPVVLQSYPPAARASIERACRQRSIELSRHWTRAHSKIQVKDTILHEIAHALVGAGEGHGAKWKAMAKSIGAKPTRCFTAKGPAKMPLYTAFCSQCGNPVPLYRMLQTWRNRSCSRCHIPPLFFDHRNKIHFQFVAYCSIALRRVLTKKEMLPKLGKRLRLPALQSSVASPSSDNTPLVIDDVQQ